METNKELTIAVGTVMQSDEGIFRILLLNEKHVLLIQLEVSKLNIIRISMDFFQYELSCRELVPIAWQEEKFQVENLTEIDEEMLNYRVQSIERMLQSIYPAWERLQSKETKPEVKKVMEELEVSKATAFKLIRRYLQSGRLKYALLDGRKGEKNRKNEYKWGESLRGHGDSKVENDEKLENIFEDGYLYFYKNREKGVSLMAAYRYIVAKYYTVTEFESGRLVTKCLPETEIPSYKRFWNYCSKKNPESISKLKISANTRRNNERLLHGNSQSGCLGPGHIVEIDEVEIDMINVMTSDSRRTVGRAVMYLAVDVYSCCIVGCWVDYANNSFVGITNLLMNFLESPAERFRKYGMEVPEGIFPSGFVPMELRTDQGAEYTSEDIRRIGRETGMNISLVAPGTGSLKGLVEQAFHQFQEMLRGAAGGVGIIMKTYGSKHYETACTDIEDVRKIAYEFVVYFNQHKRDYPLTKEMLQESVPPMPAAIWKYGCKNVMSPRWITPPMRNQFMFALLKNDRKFQISRRGVTYKGLYYELASDWFLDMMRKTENRKETFNGVRYDPRSINNIYIMRTGEVVKIPLNEIREEQRTFRDMTWKEYDELWKKKKETDRRLNGKDLEMAALTAQQMSGVIEAAKSMQQPGKNQKKKIKEARKQERAAILSENTLELRMGLADDLELQTELPNHIQESPNIEKKTKIIEVMDDNDFGDVEDCFGV